MKPVINHRRHPMHIRGNRPLRDPKRKHPRIPILRTPRLRRRNRNLPLHHHSLHPAPPTKKSAPRSLPYIPPARPFLRADQPRNKPRGHPHTRPRPSPKPPGQLQPPSLFQQIPRHAPPSFQETHTKYNANLASPLLSNCPPLILRAHPNAPMVLSLPTLAPTLSLSLEPLLLKIPSPAIPPPSRPCHRDPISPSPGNAFFRSPYVLSVLFSPSVANPSLLPKPARPNLKI